MRRELRGIRNTWLDFVAALQFLTRIPVPYLAQDQSSLARSVKFFPVVGLLVGSLAALFDLVLVGHLPRPVVSFIVIIFVICLTGCLHEDGLADAADAFGGGWNRDQILAILKDSRIGTYGGIALVTSVLSRVLLVAALPLSQVAQYLIAAHVLCRWTTLPLSYYLPPAHAESGEVAAGQGARIASLTSLGTLIMGSVISFLIAYFLLRARALFAIPVVTLVALLTGIYYKRRIDGVTGDCFGATSQISEIAVYVVGLWVI